MKDKSSSRSQMKWSKLEDRSFELHFVQHTQIP